MLKVGGEVAFSVTEPNLVTFTPEISQLKLGKLMKVDESGLTIELRVDFRPSMAVNEDDGMSEEELLA